MRANMHHAAPGTASQDAPGAVQRWFVYIVECCDGTLYTGSTTDVTRRLFEHNSTARGAKYTRARRPVRLRYHVPCDSRSSALREEIRIKRLTREQKLSIILAGESK